MPPISQSLAHSTSCLLDLRLHTKHNSQTLSSLGRHSWTVRTLQALDSSQNSIVQQSPFVLNLYSSLSLKTCAQPSTNARRIQMLSSSRRGQPLGCSLRESDWLEDVGRAKMAYLNGEVLSITPLNSQRTQLPSQSTFLSPLDRAFVNDKSQNVVRLLRNTKWQPAAMQLAVVAGLLAIQACMPAWAESLGPEVARSDQPLGFLGDLGDFQSGFTSAFLLILFSEIGDKTFFIAALLATRKSNLAVFTGTFGALAAMTVISVTLGRAFHYLDNILPFSLGNTQLPLDDLAAVVLLVYFGVSTLVEASSMEGSKAEEEQQEAELAIAGVGADGAGLQAAASTVAATFALVFVAEWGDKSFFSTIALAAASSPVGVVTGAIAGHGVATVLAVLGGAFLGTYVSEKIIAYTGGALFLVFAAATLVEILQ